MVQVDRIFIPVDRPSPLNTITPKSICRETTLAKIRESQADTYQIGFVIDVYLKEDKTSDSMFTDSYFRFVRYQQNWIWTELFYIKEQSYIPLTGQSLTFEEGLAQILAEVNE
jgi:hypothetical protein